MSCSRSSHSPRRNGKRSGAGIVANLARPGGNITGLSLLATELSAKRLELLKETLPKLVRVARGINNASVALKFKETEQRRGY
jgi:putative ABC transport system substrate-binding protein